VFQDARLFPHLAVRDNLRYGERRARARAHDLQFDAVVALLGLAPLLAGARRPVRRRTTARRHCRALLASRACCCSMNRSPASMWRGAGAAAYLENLRDHFRLPMVLVSHQFEEVLRLAAMWSCWTTVRGSPRRCHFNEPGPALRAIIGTESLGAVVDGITGEVDAASGLTQIRIGDGQLLVEAANCAPVNGCACNCWRAI